jgi:hypothetical protein
MPHSKSGATVSPGPRAVRRWSFVALGLATLWAASTPLVAAHSNGHESRTVEQCERLPGTQTAGERAQCLRCVSRPRPHHYHPDYPPGGRCRPDNGQP